MLNVWHHLQDPTQIQEDWVCEEIPEEEEGEEAIWQHRTSNVPLCAPRSNADVCGAQYIV